MHPLLVTTSLPKSELAKAFRVIQHAMGDSDEPVEGVDKPLSNNAYKDLTSSAPAKFDKQLRLGKQQWLLKLAMEQPAAADEVYAMLIKQLTKNYAP